MLNTLAEIVDEMHRSGNAQYLIEWIRGYAHGSSARGPAESLDDIVSAIDAYFEANER